MKPKVFLLVALMAVFFISTTASAQQEEITLSTYYPAPYGEYDELCAEKLLVDLPSAAELQAMDRGDCHITHSLIVGSGIGSDFSYDRLNTLGTPLYDGDVIIKGSVGIGTTDPIERLTAIGTIAAVHGGVGSGGSFDGTAAEGAVLTAGDVSTGGWRGVLLDYDDTNTVARVIATSGTDAGGTPASRSRLGLFAGDVERVGILTNGNVGIGTTVPDTRLGIAIASAANVNDGLKIFRPDFTGSPNYDYLKFGMKSDINVLYRGAISYVYNYGAENEIMTFRISSGNVGIGTTSPQAKLHVADGSTDIVKAYSSGIVDMPKQSMADVYRNSNYSVAVGFSKIDFNVENFDIQNEFDLTNDRFTATKAGKYLVTVNVWFTAMNDREGLVAAIYKNGARVAMNKTRCSAGLVPRDLGCTVSRIIDLSVGDYVEGWVENNSTVARTVGGTAPGYTGATFMSIAKIN